MVLEASDLELRPATADDIVFLVSLRNRTAKGFFDPSPATKEKTAALLYKSNTYIIQQGNDRVASFAFYRVLDGSAQFGRFMVEPELQGNGIGTRVLSLALEEAERLGLKRLRLELKEDNEAAFKLYMRAGFKSYGYPPGVIEMEKWL